MFNISVKFDENISQFSSYLANKSMTEITIYSIQKAITPKVGYGSYFYMLSHGA